MITARAPVVAPASSRARARGGRGDARGRCEGVARGVAPRLGPSELAQVSAKTTVVGTPATPRATPPATVIGAGVAVAALGVALAAKKATTDAPALAKKQKRIVIAGAPASGKGTQCEMIVKKFGLTHISAGDLLRAAVAAGTEAGKKAKEYMDRGDLVPNDVVVTMVKDRLAQPDCAKGWLLDGYPRSEEQAQALIESGINPDLFLLLDVPDEILIDRVVGRRLDPVDGTIYHMTFFPPPTPEIAARLTQRSDDTEEKAANRLAVHHRNVDAVVGKYANIMKNVDGNRAKQDVFKDIERLIKAM
ncbi:Adenylate kinase [Ostreococcus tauri]|uniref:adenylate kinase n=1 Tax=Ostreococcus tauri TaxID=70448 RepID=A0A090M851_OSTTA|nr:Adenylate kinase [Ostreococcus tauri]CEG01313.1 Adenylate kinase [Ostreococcus tauri]|eukprot:XP_003080579.2 Adenylate kinase [Ostreococcus tauri]